jgi:hypothetical protein
MATITLRATKGSPLTNNEVDANFNNLNTELGTKLASADFTGANILTKIKTVDGALSGLDADTLDGYNQDTANTNNTIVRRDGSGDFAANIITANDFQGQFTGTANITSGTITGITALSVANGGSGSSTASGARTSLGLAIGSDVQAWSAVLDDIGGVTQAADKVPYFNSATTASTMTVTSTARSLLDDTSTSAMRATLGLTIGTNVQPYDADLGAIGAITSSGVICRTGNGSAAARTIIAGTGISITNGDGVGGDITISTGQDVTTTGNVQFNSIGVGTSASGTTGRLDATTINVGTLTETSSIVYKENVNPIAGALDAIMNLQGVNFTWKDNKYSDGKQVGLIAEEVNKVIPEVVTIDSTGSAEGVQYSKLVAYLVESIKELKAEIDTLKGK